MIPNDSQKKTKLNILQFTKYIMSFSESHISISNSSILDNLNWKDVFGILFASPIKIAKYFNHFGIGSTTSALQTKYSSFKTYLINNFSVNPLIVLWCFAFLSFHPFDKAISRSYLLLFYFPCDHFSFGCFRKFS